MTQATILLADDEDTLRKNLAKVLQEEGFDVIACRDGTEALAALKANSVDALITDVRMPGMSGMDLLDRAKEIAPDAVTIVITAYGEVATAVAAMKKGAGDYICKPLIFDELILKLRQLLSAHVLARENRLLREQISGQYGFTGLVAESPAMLGILDLVKRITHTRSNVLLLGDSGTGKEALARAIHYNGVTKDNAFVAVNCGGLNENLIESELFGHRRGAFTGATADRIGYFEAADGGTLFLDEIGSLPMSSQSVLLRAIEEKAIIRVGDTRARKVNIRIIAATNSNLEKAIEEGRFREDLFYRVNIIRITLPPLRERREDIAPLVAHFVRKYNKELKARCPGFGAAALDAMRAHAWPGNVRELENVVERALIFAYDREVEPEDLPMTGTGDGTAPALPLDLRQALRQFERQHIVKVLAECGDNKAQAAEVLGIGLSSLYRKMDEMRLGRRAGEEAADGGQSGPDAPR
ncbi:MAG: sigma-54 dependent transcriptional regulator [Planctomycetota bacterium]